MAAMPTRWVTTRVTGFVFGEARLRVDKPLAIDNETLLVVGVGNQFIASEDRALWAEIGAGQRNTEFENDTSTNETIALARAGFFQTIADQLRLELDIDAVQGETLAQLTTEAGVAWRIGSGAIKYSYRSRSIKPDGGDTVSDDDAFVSFTYGF